MKYLQTEIFTSDLGLEEITGILMELGINETVVENPRTASEMLEKKHDYEWDYVDESCFAKDGEPKIVFYLSDDEEGEKLFQAVSEKIEKLSVSSDKVLLGSLKMKTTIIDDEDWMNSYKDHFKIIDLTDNIIVKPSWEDIPDGNTKKILELDPGMAFGTGDHATTSMCAVLMDKTGCNGKDVLDVGTGSGILAIAADLLGASRILGVDIDPTTVEVAKENARINNCGDNVMFIEGDLTKGIDFSADIVVANLMAEMVVMLTSSVRKHMKPGAVFISSGILTEKKDMVVKALEDEGLKVIKILSKGEWCAIMAG